MNGSNEQGYQGWTNYATWGVALIIDNDEEMQNDVQLRAYDIATDESNEAPYVTMQDWLSDYVSDVCADWSDTQNTMVKQMLQAALAEVNWHELATNYIDEVEQVPGGGGPTSADE